MAIYTRSYRPYAGAVTPRVARPFILVRYSYSRLFQSKFLVIAMALSICFPLVCAAFIYLSHNPLLLALLNQGPGVLPKVDGRFFYWFAVVQGGTAYLLTAIVGPGLVAPDFANGAMPLYFCRPFARTEYVAGKLVTLMFLLSLVTWIPGLVLFCIQASVVGGWAAENLWLARAIVSGLLIWTLFLSLLALAVSAWVKWKLAAAAIILGIFFAGAGFGAAINAVMRTAYGSLIDLSQMMHVVWSDMFRYDAGLEIHVGEAWMILGACAAVSAWLLSRRVKPFEVTK
jgi:ABC-2 type transport system permease protein